VINALRKSARSFERGPVGIGVFAFFAIIDFNNGWVGPVQCDEMKKGGNRDERTTEGR
jgi:hypothetical protein